MGIQVKQHGKMGHTTTTLLTKKMGHTTTVLLTIAVVFLLPSYSNQQFAALVMKEECGPDETECPAGCCPEPNWYCCHDDFYPGCAATADDCPYATPQERILKVEKRRCGPDETECPTSCCPMPNWYCCLDNMYPGCAPTPADCPQFT